MSKGENFLNHLYKDLYISEEVMHTANPSDSKDERVKKYLERLENVHGLAKRSNHHGIELLKEMYYKKYVIKAENIPESYFKNQEKMALDRGLGHVSVTDEEREQIIKTVIQDQKKSLDIWLDYFLSDDSMYPEWFKYYAFQGMLKLGNYDKKNGSFNKRTQSTTNIFVELNREALALVYDNLCSMLDGEKVDDNVLQKLLEGGSFSKLYAYMIKKLDGDKYIADSNDGIWIKYNQGSKPDELVKSLEGKGTGWCTAGMETAKTQLQGGDFHVYYTKDVNGEYKQPRIAIRMEGNKIGEIRGISEQQNLESEMEKILDKKLEEFPDRDEYKKKISDMEKLTLIYKEYKDRELTIEELRFLYETDAPIKGFGYNYDPRIKEILAERDFKKDLAKVFNCSEEEISDDRNDVLNGKKIIYFYGDLVLNNLKSIDGLFLPNYVGGSLYLSNLTSAEGLTLPSKVDGCLFLEKIENAQGLSLPNSIGGSLFLEKLENAQDLILPNSIGEDLYLNSLESAKGLILPNSIGGSLYLGNLTTLEGITVPKGFKCGRLISIYFTMEDLINKSLENDNDSIKKKGFSKVGILIILNLIISITLIFLGIWFRL